MKVEEVFTLAERLRDEKERLYGSESWRTLGLSGCLEAAVRKAVYLKVQVSNGGDVVKIREDLLDLINWTAFSYCLVEDVRGLLQVEMK